ncbi:YhdP family protein [Aerosticca soli]|uniref:YhdP central domain-containing protein n=1 Tax=Aerosticca soli TaxID=2010829 RepID=A0A2Z6E7W3_9GAMM|nr:YhdP family protein [Aerosticca soli]BBD80801.1 hypothetical protein ALSL_2175 [Aerosticca soli]
MRGLGPAWARRLHRFGRALWFTLGSLLVAFAALVAVAQLTLPILADHPQWLAAQLSARLGRPIGLATVEAHWQPHGPRFVLHEVSIGSATGGAPLRLPALELDLDLRGWLRPSGHLLNLRVRGLELDLSRDAQGRWHIAGIGPTGGDEREPLRPLSLGLWLDDLRVNLSDEAHGTHMQLHAQTLHLSRQGRRVRFGAVLRREGAPGLWHGAGDFLDDGSRGRLWLAGTQADLHALLDGTSPGGYGLRSGHGDLAAWLDWRAGRVTHAVLRADLTGLAVDGPQGTVAVPAFHGLVALDRQEAGDLLHFAGDDGGALVLALDHAGTPDLTLRFAARRLVLADLLPWLALSPGLPTGLAQWLRDGHPHGTLDAAVGRWSRRAGLETAQASFHALGVDAVGALPGFGPLQGSLRADPQALALALPAQATTLALPRVFARPFALARLDGEIVAWPAEEGWHVGTDALAFEGAGFGGQARGEAVLPAAGGRPFLDLYARIDHAEVTAAPLFWPVHSMPPSAQAWLNRALVAGHIQAADALIRGDLSDWPFRQHEGRFEARAVIDGLTFDYGEDWPRADGLHALASFVDNGMEVDVDRGQSLGVQVESARARIADFGDIVLDLAVQGGGSGMHLRDFLRQSPIARSQDELLSKLELGGSGHFDFTLQLPVGNADALRVDGRAQLKDMDLKAPAWKVALARLGGPVRFDAHGAHLGPLQGGFRGQAATVEADIAGATGRPDTAFAAHLDSRLGTAELLQDLPALDWLKAVASGRSAFRIDLAVSRDGARAPWTPVLTLGSDLVGMRVALPAPLDKAPADALPLQLRLPLPAGSADLQLALRDVLRARLRLPDEHGRPLAGSLLLGNGAPEAPPAQGLRVRGRTAKLDVSGWIAQVAGGAGADGGPGLESLDVTAGTALLFGRPFASMRLRAQPEGDVMGFTVDAPALAGRVRVPQQDLRRRGVTLQLDRLYWPQDTTAAARPAATPAEAAATGIDPASLPPFHLQVDDLRLGEARLGQARLESWPTATGMHIDPLRALSRKVQISASGDWDGNARDSHTHLVIDFSATDVDSLLDALGLGGEPIFQGGQTRARLDARWPGAPSSFALPDMDGTLHVEIRDGRILEVKPGVGRLFGLVSLTELPRRLTLDFGDVFGKGLAFDLIAGDFRFGDGNAYTGNLKIKGPAADITIKGRAGLRARDYDQDVRVVPHVGSSLPVVGAVMGGPVGAAAGLAVQGILGHGLNKAAAARYRVTGSWDKPVMTLIERSAPAGQ